MSPPRFKKRKQKIPIGSHVVRLLNQCTMILTLSFWVSIYTVVYNLGIIYKNLLILRIFNK